MKTMAIEIEPDWNCCTDDGMRTPELGLLPLARHLVLIWGGGSLHRTIHLLE